MYACICTYINAHMYMHTYVLFSIVIYRNIFYSVNIVIVLLSHVIEVNKSIFSWITYDVYLCVDM